MQYKSLPQNSLVKCIIFFLSVCAFSWGITLLSYADESDGKDNSCTITLYAGDNSDANNSDVTKSEPADSNTDEDNSKNEDASKKILWSIPETWINGVFMIDENSKMTPLTATQLYVCVDGTTLHQNKQLITKITIPDCKAKNELVVTGVMGTEKSCPASESPSTGSLAKSRNRFVLISKCFKNIYNLKENSVFQTISAEGVANNMYKKIDGLWDHNFDTDLCKDEETKG